MGLLADTRPLRYTPFRKLWVANIVTVIGAQMTVVAIPAQIFHITGSSGYVGLLARSVWSRSSSSGCGALADVFDRRKLLVISTVGLIITSTILAPCSAERRQCLAAAVRVFDAAGILRPSACEGALIPSIVPLKLLPAANSLNMTADDIGCRHRTSPRRRNDPAVRTRCSTSSMPCSCSPPSCSDSAAVAAAAGQPDTRSGFKGIVDGFRYLRTNTVVMVSLLVDIIAMVFGLPRALFPQIAPRDPTIRPRAESSSPLFAALAAGSALAGIFGLGLTCAASRTRRHRRHRRLGCGDDDLRPHSSLRPVSG